jgi:hypothetical protein
MQPDHRRSLRCFNRLGHSRIRALGKAHGGCKRGTKLKVISPRHAQAVFNAAESASTELKNFAYIAHVVSS